MHTRNMQLRIGLNAGSFATTIIPKPGTVTDLQHAVPLRGTAPQKYVRCTVDDINPASSRTIVNSTTTQILEGFGT